MGDSERIILMDCKIQFVLKEDGTTAWWAEVKHGDEIVFYRRATSHAEIVPHLQLLMGQAETLGSGGAA